MRFAFLTELFSPSVGGQEIFFKELAETLVSFGHIVDVYTTAHDVGLLAKESLAGVTVRRYPVAPRYTRPWPRQLRRDWFAVLRYAMWVGRAVERKRYDYHLLNQWPLVHALMLSRSVRARGALHWCEIRGGPFFRLVQSQLPKAVRSNFAVSASVAAAISAASGRDCGQLPSGIVTSRYVFRPRAERRDLLFLGRLMPHKNLELAVDALGIARQRGFSGRLIIAGDGPARPMIEAHVARVGLKAHVDVLGMIDEAKKVDLLSRALVLGVPSRREGFPRAVAEAMASGTPTATVDFPENGTKDVLRAYGCGIVAESTAESLADALIKVERRWDHYSMAGLRGAEELDWAVIARRLEAAAQMLYKTKPELHLA